MSWLSHIQSKSRAEKLRIIWIIAGIILVILVALWIIAGKVDNPGNKDSNFFQDINEILKNAKEKKPDLIPNK